MRRANRNIRLVAVTGYGQKDASERSSRAGFDAHLVKPVQLERLQLVVRDLLARPMLAGTGQWRLQSDAGEHEGSRLYSRPSRVPSATGHSGLPSGGSSENTLPHSPLQHLRISRASRALPAAAERKNGMIERFFPKEECT